VSNLQVEAQAMGLMIFYIYIGYCSIAVWSAAAMLPQRKHGLRTPDQQEASSTIFPIILSILFSPCSY
jgi:hypothetical protein